MESAGGVQGELSEELAGVSIVQDILPGTKISAGAKFQHDGTQDMRMCVNDTCRALNGSLRLDFTVSVWKY